MPTPQYSLTAVDVMDLRVRMARAGAAFILDGMPPTSAPFIVWGGDEYSLHASGACLARSESANVICALIRNERIEPGFTRALLDASDPCDLLALPPDLRAAERARRAKETAKYKEAQRAASTALTALPARTPRIPKPGDLDYIPPTPTKNLTLDDLF